MRKSGWDYERKVVPWPEGVQRIPVSARLDCSTKRVSHEVPATRYLYDLGSLMKAADEVAWIAARIASDAPVGPGVKQNDDDDLDAN